MSTLLIIVLFLLEGANIFWMIFQAPLKFSVGQILGWAFFSLLLWGLLIGYFMNEGKSEKEKNKD